MTSRAKKEDAQEATVDTQPTLTLPWEGEITPAALSKLYPYMAAPLPEEAIQRAETKSFKGYDTTGVGYQYCENRMNEVVGPSHWVTEHTMEVIEGTGKKAFCAVCTMRVAIGNWNEVGEFVAIAEREGYGNHESSSKGDALKGAYTNAFKKVVSGFGVGRQAYEGSLDDDYRDGDGVAPNYQLGGRPAQTTTHNAPQRAQDAAGEANTAKQTTSTPATPKNAAEAPAELTCPECGKKISVTEQKYNKDHNIPQTCWKHRPKSS